MKDIETRADLELLLSGFYKKLLHDAEMKRIFIDVMQIRLAEHLPVIADFWEQVILGTGDYRNNIMQIHLGIHGKTPLLPLHFKTWLETFESVVDGHFSGENAEKAKTRATSIATVMQLKLNNPA